MKELVVEFKALSKAEKLQLIKEIMPDMCKLFGENTQEMMTFCKDMMKECNVDMSQMMSMMKKY